MSCISSFRVCILHNNLPVVGLSRWPLRGGSSVIAGAAVGFDVNSFVFRFEFTSRLFSFCVCDFLYSPRDEVFSKSRAGIITGYVMVMFLKFDFRLLTA